MKNTASIIVLIHFVLLLSGCSKPINEIMEWNTEIVSERSSNSETHTKALYVNNNTITAKWSINEKIVAVNPLSLTTKFGMLQPSSNEANSILSGRLSGSFIIGDIIDLYFPYSVYSASGISLDYTCQDGSIESLSQKLDYGKASVTVTNVDIDNKLLTTTNAIFESQQAIACFTFIDGNGTTICVKSLEVSSEGNTLVQRISNGQYTYGKIDVTLQNPTTNEIFIAMCNSKGSSDSYFLKVTDKDGTIWEGTATANLQNGRFYPGTLRLSRQVKFSSMQISDVSPSLISQDHTAEGILLTMPTGRIWHFFRLDPGTDGNHTGKSGAIYKRFTDDEAKNWSSPELIFDDPDYDDRNLGGGMTDNGDIVLFFRRYDVATKTTVDVNYIISNDFGITFSERRVLSGFSKRPMRFVSTGHGKYIVPLFEDGLKSEVRSFTVNGGVVWFNDDVWEFEDNGAGFTEPVLSVDGSRIICLFRCDFTEGVYSSYSNDGGITFTDPIKTNMISDRKVSLPLIIYDSNFNYQMWCLIGDRGSDLFNQKLWIYNSSIDNGIENAQGYIFANSIERPVPTAKRFFYCYPTSTLMKNGQYLVVFTEGRLAENGTEDADLYQFFMTPQI